MLHIPKVFNFFIRKRSNILQNSTKNKVFFCNFQVLSQKMTENTDISYSYETFQNFLERYKDKNEAVQNYLKQISYSPISDFSKGLEWFNVSEPLSFSKHLKGKIVVLDFFTYCCINCMHIIPDLREIEEQFSVKDGLVVIGVHSAKFENEKKSSNILAAVQRYNILHPVVNDFKSDMWRECDVHCWPTLLIIGPKGVPIVMFMGEGHKEDVKLFIENALAFYGKNNEIESNALPYKSAYHLLPDLKGPLLFPGKIAHYFDKSNSVDLLAISDTGNNRILIINNSGLILKQIGGSRVGFKDGKLKEALFNNPQGLVFQNKDIIFVADTENHAIRKIDLNKNLVETVAGTGVQGHDRTGGNSGKKQTISSPWDVCIFKTKDLNKIDDQTAPVKEVLIIAMAGTHQIWALFLDDIVWWKSKKYSVNTCVSIAGSGREENRNNEYPHAAAFAQPSGLALCEKSKEIYIADSESSSIRRLSLSNGKVTAVVGGNKNPNNLFAFGDKDGTLYEAKLQHCLGLAVSKDEKTVFVADTYNHKVKTVDVSQNSVQTLSLPPLTDTTDSKSSIFSEPAGLCISSNEGKMYLADTNNHCIKILHIKDNQIGKIETLQLKDDSIEINKSSLEIVERNSIISVNDNGGKVILFIETNYENGLKITEDVPQKWFVNVPNSTWSCIPNTGTSLNDLSLVLSVPPCLNNKITKYNVDLTFNLITCTAEKCLPKSFVLRQVICYESYGKTTINDQVKILLNPKEDILLK